MLLNSQFFSGQRILREPARRPHAVDTSPTTITAPSTELASSSAKDHNNSAVQSELHSNQRRGSLTTATHCKDRIFDGSNAPKIVLHDDTDVAGANCSCDVTRNATDGGGDKTRQHRGSKNHVDDVAAERHQCRLSMSSRSKADDVKPVTDTATDQQVATEQSAAAISPPSGMQLLYTYNQHRRIDSCVHILLKSWLRHLLTLSYAKPWRK